MKTSWLDKAFHAAVEHHQAGRLAEAETGYRKVLATQPNHADALHLLGVLAAQIGRFDDAVRLIGRAVALCPNVADYQTHLGNALGEKKDFAAAIGVYRQALRLKPGCFIALDGLGAALRETGQLDEAAASHGRSLHINPNNPTAHYNLGLTLARTGLLEEAKASYRRAIEIAPNFADAHWNLALILLMQGDFERGWREYEWRWRRANFPSLWPQFSQPRWNGEDLTGKRVLVHTEQGYGDAVQFVRYAPLLAARVRESHFVPGALARLMEHADGVDQVVSAIVSPDELPPFDVHCPMLSLPFLFGTRLASIPAEVPYLRADPALRTRWGEKVAMCVGREVGGFCNAPPLAASQIECVGQPTTGIAAPQIHNVGQPMTGIAATPICDAASGDTSLGFGALRSGQAVGLTVGLAWAGSPTNKNDRYRSITLAQLAPLGRASAAFYSLQAGPTASQAGNPPAGMELIDLTPAVQDFADTAALISHLDLVITVDTAVAHLAGALGKPAWVLLAIEQDWRWLLKREDTPWYPTLRLFRQRMPGDWPEVIERVAGALAEYRPKTRLAA